jgi:hypothetical protein
MNVNFVVITKALMIDVHSEAETYWLCYRMLVPRALNHNCGTGLKATSSVPRFRRGVHPGDITLRCATAHAVLVETAS